jgi:hypothetical protein
MNNDDCVICFEHVADDDKYINECECKYTVHAECVSKWDEKCLMCNKPTQSVLIAIAESNRREVVLERLLLFFVVFSITGGIYILSKYAGGVVHMGK